MALFLILSSGRSRAQSMDYGALEELFGEPVTTSVTGSPQRASEVPASITIVTQDEIRRSGARDIPGILRHVAGIDVLQWSNDNADVAVRGYNQAFSPRLLVLVNGQQVYADYYGYTAWGTLPVELSDIRQIEVVKGPNSALFGFNAVGGVVNIITFDPRYDDTNVASVSVGTQGLLQASGVATYKLDDETGLRISLGGRRGDDFSTPQRPSDFGSRLGDDRTAVDILAHTTLIKGVDASFELSHSETRGPEFIPAYVTYFARYRVSSIGTDISADTAIGLLRAKVYASWFKGDARSSDPAVPVYRLDNPLYVAKLDDIFKIENNHTIRLSVEYRHTDMATTPLAGAHVFYQVFAAGAMWQWNFESGMSLTNAVRVDHLELGRRGTIPPGFGLTNADWKNRSLTEISFNSGVVWQHDNDTLRATAARGVQLPNLIDFGGLVVPVPPFGYAAGVPTLKPTIVTNYEVSWDRKLPEWNARLRVRIFDQMSHDVLANGGASLLPAGLISTPANIGNSKATGVEVMLDGTLQDDWRWGLSYTPEFIEDDFLPGFALASTFTDFAHTQPVHVVNANLGWAHGPWEADGYVRYQSKFDGIQGSGGLSSIGSLVPIVGYVSMDARLAYRIASNLTIALSGQNLLQSPQRQTSAAAVERRIEFTAAVEF